MTLKEDQLRAYRSDHVIVPVDGTFAYCAVDLLPIYRIRPYTGDNFRHAPEAVKRLIRETALGARLAERVGTK